MIAVALVVCVLAVVCVLRFSRIEELVMWLYNPLSFAPSIDANDATGIAQVRAAYFLWPRLMQQLGIQTLHNGARAAFDSVDVGGGQQVPVRVVEPSGGQHDVTVVFFHPGGFVVGENLQGDDMLLSRVAVENNAKIISVNYRLAPEHAFPAAHEDAFNAYCSIRDSVAGKIAIMGVSAGGNLAMVTAIRSSMSLSTRQCDPPDALIAIHGVYDATLSGDSWHSVDGQILSARLMHWFRAMALRGDVQKAHHWFSSPATMSDNVDFSGLKETRVLLLAAGKDILRDDSLQMAERLKAANLKNVELVVQKDIPHCHYMLGWPFYAAEVEEFFALIAKGFNSVKK